MLRQQSLFLLDFSNVNLYLLDAFVILFPLVVQTKQINGVIDDLALDLLVQGAIRTKARGVVDLKQVRLTLLVQHDIVAQNFKGQRILVIVHMVVFIPLV
jgi:hypothetical protein